MDDQILSLEHISLSYHTMKGETPALCDLTFSVKPGEFVALVGPSGCGKSTILNLISGLLKPEAGTLLSRGRPITEADLHIGYMLQRDHLFEWRTIYSNVLLGLEISRTLTPEDKMQEFNASGIESKALGFVFDNSEYADQVSALNNVISQYNGALSSGSGDPEELLPQFLEALDDAGIDDVIAAKQEQLDAFLAAK